jgi:hypothetical protein
MANRKGKAMSKTRIKTAQRAATKPTKQKTMRAAALDGFGGPEMITLHTLPVPEVGPDEVLIRVESAGVGAWDPYEREGGFAGMSGSKPKFLTCSARRWGRSPP